MRRSTRSPKKQVRAFSYIVATALTVLAAAFVHKSGDGKIVTPFGSGHNYESIRVERVVDGDTLKLANGERVRLIGIDTPEVHESAKLYRDARKSGQEAAAIQAMGKRASDFTRGLVEGKNVRLDFDVEKKDKYHRLLAYVYLRDGTFVNAEIVKEGYASLLTYAPNVAHVDEFRALYKEAREAKRGLWAD